MTKKITKLIQNGEEYFIREYQNKWQPWANTLLYLPLNITDTYLDKSWNNIQTTNNWVTFGTYTSDNVDCWYFDWSSNNIAVTPFNINFKNYTCAIWSYAIGWELDAKIIDMRNNIQLTFVFWTGWKGYALTGVKDWNWTATNFNPWWNYTNKWVLVGFTMDNWIFKMYIKWDNLDSSQSYTCQLKTAITPDYINIWNEYDNNNSRHYQWYLSNLILENKSRSASDWDDYFNQTKSLYWIS